MVFLNRTVFDIPLTWNRARFEATRRKCQVARKLIGISINAQFERQMRGVFFHNMEIGDNINDLNERLFKCQEKLRVLDNMIELASQSLRTYFDKRMESVRAIVQEHCNIIQQIIREEAEHWQEIHAVMDQNLLNPGDIRSRNNYPRTVQKSPAPNIDTIEEEEDEEYVSKLVNGQTLTPLLTQMIRRSRLQSNRLTIVPSIRVHVPVERENSAPRKEEQFSIHIIPLSTARQPLNIVDTTFVVKPEDTMIDGDDEPNGTYRAPNQYHYSQLPIPQAEASLIDSQPNIPARLCFSPTILQDATISEENINEQSLSDNDERFKTVLLPIDQNRTKMKNPAEDPRRFGQTFLLDIVKTEQIDDDQPDYVRPTIPDDDVIVVFDSNPLERRPLRTNDNRPPKTDPAVQQEIPTVQETVAPKSRPRVPTKTKSKPVIVSARKTRSAAKVIAEREAAVAVKVSIEKPPENKRKTRKRKQSKSVDRLAETSDEENAPSSSTHTIVSRKNIKKRKKSKTDHHSPESSDDNNENLASNNTKRKTRKRNDHQQDAVSDNDTRRRKTKKIKEREMSDNEDDRRATSTRQKKTKIATNDQEEQQTKMKKRKPKTKKTKNEDEDQTSTRSSAKRNHRPN